MAIKLLTYVTLSTPAGIYGANRKPCHARKKVVQISGKPAYILLAYTGRVGEDTPVYLTWQADAPLFEKGEQGMVAGSRKTKISGIVTLAKVPGVDAAGTALSDNKDAAYYQIYQEGGWLPAVSVQKISQYALGELGFATLDKAPASFDLIDGINQPNNVVKGILEQLYKAAQEETRTTHALTRTGILPLSKVQTEADKSTKQEYWQLRPENAYALKGQAEPQLLSQYDLARLGFRTETAEPSSFDYLDGKNQPVGFFRSLINSLYEAATGDTRTFPEQDAAMAAGKKRICHIREQEMRSP